MFNVDIFIAVSNNLLAIFDKTKDGTATNVILSLHYVGKPASAARCET